MVHAHDLFIFIEGKVPSITVGNDLHELKIQITILHSEKMIVPKLELRDKDFIIGMFGIPALTLQITSIIASCRHRGDAHMIVQICLSVKGSL